MVKVFFCSLFRKSFFFNWLFVYCLVHPYSSFERYTSMYDGTGTGIPTPQDEDRRKGVLWLKRYFARQRKYCRGVVLFCLELEMFCVSSMYGDWRNTNKKVLQFFSSFSFKLPEVTISTQYLLLLAIFCRLQCPLIYKVWNAFP